MGGYVAYHLLFCDLSFPPRTQCVFVPNPAEMLVHLFCYLSGRAIDVSIP